MRLPANGRISQGFHSAHQAIDIVAPYRSPIVAPHSGKVVHVGQLGSGTSDCGLAIDIEGGGFKSRLCHNDQLLVTLGQNVSEGQQIALMGYTGYTQPDNTVAGTHCHWVLWKDGVRVDGSKHLTGGSMAKDSSIVRVFHMGLDRDPDPGALVTYRAVSDEVLINSVYDSAERKSVLANRAKRIADLQAALANEQAKPPREVVKEVEKIVEKIVEKPVEVIKEVPVVMPVDEKAVVESFIKRLWNSLFRR